MNRIKYGIIVLLLMLCAGACQEKPEEPVENQGTTAPTLTSLPEISQKPGSGPEEDLILIDEERFGGKNFCAFLRSNYDLNQDGFLSEMERRSVKEIDYCWGTRHEVKEYDFSLEPEEMKGFELFPELEEVWIDYADRVVIRGAQLLKSFGSGEGCIREAVLEDCPNLETIFYTESSGNLSVRNCEKLYSYRNEFLEGTLSFSQTPDLHIEGAVHDVDITLDADAFLSCFDMRRLDAVTLERCEEEQLLLRIPPLETQIRWNGVKEDFITLAEGFPLLYIGEEAFQEMYSFERFDKIEDIYDDKGRKGYNICVTYQGKRESKEAFSLYVDGVPEIEKLYLRPEKAEEVELYGYSPNKGVLFCTKWNLSLRYRTGEEDIVLGTLKNKQKQIWFIDGEGKPHCYESRKDALEDNGIRSAY